MSFDVSVGVSSKQSFESWAALVAGLEAEGAGRVWVIDSQLAMKDVYAGLVVAALHTIRLGLGTGVTNAVTRHPSVTANAIAAVNELSRGRAILGLGAGDSALYGIGLKPQKVAEVEEAVGYFRAQLGSIPIYLAVSQQRMCELAGRIADGAIVMGPAQPDMVRQQVDWVRASGRHEVEICFIAPTSTDVEDVRSWASTQARLMTHHKELPSSLERFRGEIDGAADAYDYSKHLSTSAEHGTSVSDDLVRALAIVGAPEECAGRLRSLRACGIDTFIFPLAGRNRLERWRRLRTEILDQIMV